MSRLKSNIADWALSLLFGVAVFLFWWRSYPFALSYHEQFQLFLFGGDYLVERLGEPGGAARYLSEFLVQFYNNVLAGAAVIAVLLVLMQRLERGLMLNAQPSTLNPPRSTLHAQPPIDLDLVSLMMQYGRYLLISSSQPGGQPANLQGVWNDKEFAPWDSKYTININAEMNYWPALVANLAETQQPLFDMIEDLSVTGAVTARQMYGCGGWMAHHNTDLWRIAGPVDGAPWGMFPTGGAWLTTHLWQHFLFTGDKQFLAKYFPIMKGAADFLVDYMQKDPKTGWLVTVPTVSPEHGPKGKRTPVTAGTTMDAQIARDVLSNTIKATSVLIDNGQRSKVKGQRSRYEVRGSRCEDTLNAPRSTLHAQRSTLNYFPAYELMNDELRDYRFYAADMLHPSDQAVDFIWERLVETYFSQRAKGWLDDWRPVKQALMHRPFNADSDEYRAFMDKTMLKVEALRKKYPTFALLNQ